MENINEYYVYAWFRKSTGEVFHVGKGKGNRYLETKISRNNFFKSIIEKYPDDVDVKKLYENLTDDEACDLEKKTILEYKQNGECKTNFHEGGRGGNTGNYDNPERSRKLSISAKNRKHHNRRKMTDSEKKELSKKIKTLWEENPSRFLTEKRIESYKARIPWNKGKKGLQTNNRKGIPLTEQEYIEMMNRDCPYRYEVYYDNKLVYWCLGHTRLYNFCKEKFNISKTIVKQILKSEWKQKFNKHKHLETLKITKTDRSVSTMGDECSPVEWRLQPFEVHGNLIKVDDIVS